MRLFFTFLSSIFYLALSAQTKQKPTIINGGNNQFGTGNTMNINIDPNYVPDSENFIVEYADKNRLKISPKNGVWNNVFVAIPDTFLLMDGANIQNVLRDCRNVFTVIEIPSTRSGTIPYKRHIYSCKTKALENSNCSKNRPLCIPIKTKNCFFIFGDCPNCEDYSKWYAYDFGKIYWFYKDPNFRNKK